MLCTRTRTSRRVLFHGVKALRMKRTNSNILAALPSIGSSILHNLPAADTELALRELLPLSFVLVEAICGLVPKRVLVVGPHDIGDSL